MTAARRWASDRGADALDLRVYEFNKEALNFYQRLGYTTIIRTMSLRLK
jgi:GNAT superfamily N-acetyltransferase